jgi:hypothetical protein
VGALDDPVVVELPLGGEWLVERGPAARDPSHGADVLGQHYAYDLVASTTVGADTCLLRLRQPVHASFDGVIVQAVDGVASRWL